MYADISLPDLYKATEQQPSSPTLSRTLFTRNPEVVESYLHSVKKYYKDHQMEERMDQLFRDYKTMNIDQVRQLLQKWDLDQGSAMMHAERSIRRNTNQYQWSPKLRNSAVLRIYWKLRLRELSKGHNYTTTFYRWREKIRQSDPAFDFPHLTQQLSIETIRAHFNRATKVFRKTQQNSQSIRIQSYEDMILTYQRDTNPETEKESQRKARIVMQTIQTETIQTTFRHLREIVNPSTASALSKLMVPTIRQHTLHTPPDDFHAILRDFPESEVTWETYIDKKSIETHLLSYNREAFRAAAKSPCGHGIIYDAITYTSLSKESLQLLQGEVPREWHGNDMVLKEFLASFAIPTSVLNQQPINTKKTSDLFYVLLRCS
jgi:hypothetical protein